MEFRQGGSQEFASDENKTKLSWAPIVFGGFHHGVSHFVQGVKPTDSATNTVLYETNAKLTAWTSVDNNENQQKPSDDDTFQFSLPTRHDLT